MPALGSVEVYEIDDDEHETVVKTVLDGNVVSETRIPKNAEEDAVEQRSLAEDRLNRLITAQNKITFLEREAARHVAQLQDARNALAALKTEAEASTRNALAALKTEAEASTRDALAALKTEVEASALQRIRSIAGHLECGACYELLCDPVMCAINARYRLQHAYGSAASLLAAIRLARATPLTRRPMRDVTVRKAAEAAMSLLNPQRLADLRNKRGTGFADGSAWVDFTFATDK
ncbi:hypothetical protein EV121DRAFT_297369 [Schizophyllum commune]